MLRFVVYFSSKGLFSDDGRRILMACETGIGMSGRLPATCTLPHLAAAGLFRQCAWRGASLDQRYTNSTYLGSSQYVFATIHSWMPDGPPAGGPGWAQEASPWGYHHLTLLRQVACGQHTLSWVSEWPGLHVLVQKTPEREE